ncbi:MAG: hypothetical protein HOO96_22640 [Polyangiaceae bacterium]|nr:hypothetical protein [Polyangiaceae bacterium]
MNDPKQPVSDLDSLLAVLDMDQLENVSGGYRMNCDMDGVQQVADNSDNDGGDWGGGDDGGGDWGGGDDGGGDWA